MGVVGFLVCQTRKSLLKKKFLRQQIVRLSWVERLWWFYWRLLSGIGRENKKAIPEVRERCKQAQYTLGVAPGQKTPKHDRERNNVIILCGCGICQVLSPRNIIVSGRRGFDRLNPGLRVRKRPVAGSLRQAQGKLRIGRYRPFDTVS